MSAHRVAIVGCGFPQLSLIRLARQLGLHVIGLDLNPKAVGVADCHEFALVSTNDVEGIKCVVREFAADALTTTGSEVSLRATAHACFDLDLPFHADPETIRRCQEKDAMRAGYEAADVPVPPYARVTTLAEATRFAESSGLPIVVKPSRGWGQRGVAKVVSMDDLADAFLGAMEQSSSAGLDVVVCEAFLEGREYSVNGWIEDGVLVNYCVTERLTVPQNKPLGVMIAELYSSGLTPSEEQKVITAARDGARALGHVRGPCYSQVVFSKSGCFLFETAARMGGGFDADVTKLASGVDLYKRILGVALNDRSLENHGKLGNDRTACHGAAVAKFLIGKPGVVQSIDGLAAARAMPGIVDAEAFVPVGGTVHPLTDSAKRAGYVLAVADTREQVLERADRALATIRLQTR
jgi:biotin carboxylase